MKTLKRRTVSLLVIIAVMIAGLGVYVARLVRDGREWASFGAAIAASSSGSFTPGTVFDRNGVVLATSSEGYRIYSEDEDVRRATLHAVGDLYGNIGTGALSVFSAELTGYNLITGTYSADGSGGKVYLSIDADLNVAAYDALYGRRGAVAVADCDTGELLCMVSSPTFDPQDPPESLDDDEYYEGVYINRVLSSAYTPGSIFKLVTLAAALENIDDIYDRTFTCDGYTVIGDEYISCTGEHGELGIREALAVSCNCAFAELALELGGDTIRKYAEQYGLLESIYIDGVPTAEGSFIAEKTGSPALAWSGVGQDMDTVNPMSFLRFITAIANGGYASELTQLKDDGPCEKTRIMEADTASALADMMIFNVYYTYGEDNYPDIELYAKSGTAEVGSDLQPHAWFVGFARAEGRTLAFAVVIENGGWGSSEAGAVANAVLQKAFFNR